MGLHRAVQDVVPAPPGRGCRPGTGFLGGCLAEQKGWGPPPPRIHLPREPRAGEEGRMGWSRDERDRRVTGVLCHQGQLNFRTDGR